MLSDQLDAVQRTSKARGLDEPDLSLLVDGLRAEREQGITIDVAYRYFATPRRTFILADTPGHVQYTRNTVTGASTADLVVILTDARTGVVGQTRRHAAVAALLGAPHLLLAVNKIDLVDFDQTVFDAIATEFSAYAADLGVPEVTAIPVSALHGDNVVARSDRIAWYSGPSVLEHLEEWELAERPTTGSVRFPVSTSSGRAPPNCRTTGGTRVVSRPAPSGRATRSSCFRRAGARWCGASTRRTGRGPSRWPVTR